MLEFLAQPWIQSVEYFTLFSNAWLQSPAMQRALFALPHLSSLALFVDAKSDSPCVRLDSAASQATKLTRVELWVRVMGNRSVYRGLRAAPALSSIDVFLSTKFRSERDSLALLIWLMRPSLTELRLNVPFTIPMTRSAVKTMFVRLPQIRTLRTGLDPAMLIQGMLDAGISALPDLRRVNFDDGIVEARSLLRRFLRKFSTVTVQFHLVSPQQTSKDKYEAFCAFQRAVGSWPRVEVTPALTTLGTEGAPSPHPSDDEAESDVELDVEPNEPDVTSTPSTGGSRA